MVKIAIEMFKMSFDLENDLQGQRLYFNIVEWGHIVGSWQYI